MSVTKLRHTGLILLLWALPLGAAARPAAPAPADSLGLQQAVEAALQHNHLLRIRKLQEQESRSRVREARIRHYPTVMIDAGYRYRVNTGSLDIPQGSLGALPLGPNNVVALPGRDLSFKLGSHRALNLGVSLYQPLTQQAKISSGVQLAWAERRIAGRKREQAAQELTLGVEKVYYRLLINRKQQEEARDRLEAARLKLQQARDALEAGKAVEAQTAGLQAEAAEKEQELLKLQIEAEDYRGTFEKLTGLSADAHALRAVDDSLPEAGAPEAYAASAEKHNAGLQVAALKQEKAHIAVQAARRSYLPDVGLVAGYRYQEGNDIYPAYNPFVGARLQWNLQELFTNRQTVQQRRLKTRQAKENLAEQRMQVDNELKKAYRKLHRLKTLVQVARKNVRYREQALHIQASRDTAGLSTRTDLLEARADLSKARADLYAARLQYRLAYSKLQQLAGGEVLVGEER